MEKPAEGVRETKDHSRPTKCETLAPLAPPFESMPIKIRVVNSAFEEKCILSYQCDQ